MSQEQQNRFGLHGYVAACIIPEEFETDYPGGQYLENMEADYAPRDGLELRKMCEGAKIVTEQDFKEAMKHVLSDCQENR